MAKQIKLHYFNGPGRGEATRLMLAVANIPFEDHRIEFQEWPALKATMPFGSLPVLEVDGKVLAQSYAIVRYVASMTSLEPKDAWSCAQADQIWFALDDMLQPFNPTFKLPADEQAAAQRAVLEGPVHEWLLRFSAMVDAAGTGWMAGDSLSYADIVLFCALGNLITGYMKGVPTDTLNKYPSLKAFHTKIASLPAVSAYYANKSDPFAAAFRAQP